MDILFHVKCMFPKHKLFSFTRTPSNPWTLITPSTSKISDVMIGVLEVLIMNGIAKTNIQISCINEVGRREIFVTILDNINVLKIAKMLGLEKPPRNNKLKTLNLGDRYFVVSFDGVKAGAA